MNSGQNESKMTIEEFGKFIEAQNKILVAEKSRKYSLISDEESSEQSCFSLPQQCLKVGDHQIDFIGPQADQEEFRSPLSFRMDKARNPLVFLSSGSSEKKKERIENPFRSQFFKQKLSFHEIPEEEVDQGKGTKKKA